RLAEPGGLQPTAQQRARRRRRAEAEPARDRERGALGARHSTSHVAARIALDARDVERASFAQPGRLLGREPVRRHDLAGAHAERAREAPDRLATRERVPEAAPCSTLLGRLARATLRDAR